MILYFSGTGNSKYVAKRIADALGDKILNLNDRIKASDTSLVETGERVIIVTPTYAWRIPRVVRDWLLKTELRGAKQAWFVMTCGSEIGNADRYNRELCAEKAISCMGTAQIVMPENYIAMFFAPQADKARQIVAQAEPSIDRAIAAIQRNQPFAPTRNNLYDRFMSGPVNPIFYKFFVKANAFTASSACIGCGQCVPLCPRNALSLEKAEKGRHAVIDKERCIGCYECVTACKQGAIGVDTPNEYSDFAERMAEYAYGAVKGKEGRICYLNFLLNVTPQCDCAGWSEPAIVPDLGILASEDPVALDTACFDLVKEAHSLIPLGEHGAHSCGYDKFSALHPNTRGWHQVEYAESIGMGSRDYELITV